jgi:Tfp pilus assembly protein PilF
VVLLKNQEEIYSKHFGQATAPMIEEMLSGYGYMNMQMGESKKALMFFEMNLKHNPFSAAAFESIADYYESQNDAVNALKSISKAYELSGSDYYQKRITELKAQE